jgi:hypothetical protein
VWPDLPPDHRASPELPSTDKTGEQLFEEGYGQSSSHGRIVTPPFPSNQPLDKVQKDVLLALDSLPIDKKSAELKRLWYHLVEPTKRIGLTEEQFKAFHYARKNNVKNIPSPTSPKPSRNSSKVRNWGQNEQLS